MNWQAQSRSVSDGALVIKDEEFNEICVIREMADRHYGPQNVADMANSELIVKAVNCHDDLVAALDGLNSWGGGKYFCSCPRMEAMSDLGHSTACQQARAALAKAKS